MGSQFYQNGLARLLHGDTAWSDAAVAADFKGCLIEDAYAPTVTEFESHTNMISGPIRATQDGGTPDVADIEIGDSMVNPNQGTTLKVFCDNTEDMTFLNLNDTETMDAVIVAHQAGAGDANLFLITYNEMGTPLGTPPGGSSATMQFDAGGVFEITYVVA